MDYLTLIALEKSSLTKTCVIFPVNIDKTTYLYST